MDIADMHEKIGSGGYFKGDCLEVMTDIPDASIDLVLADLPYAVSEKHWDSIIDPDKLFEHYARICKPIANVVLTCQQPFTTTLINHGTTFFPKFYPLIWDKGRATGYAQANRRPMAAHEDVLVFYRGRATFNPGTTKLDAKIKRNRKNTAAGKDTFLDRDTLAGEYEIAEIGYPTSIIKVDPIELNHWDWIDGAIHPTRKPVPLFQQLISWYSNPGDTVLDNTAGSGTTALAAQSLKRNWICIEQDEHYYEVGTYLINEFIRRCR